jgi:hypothetical protein
LNQTVLRTFDIVGAAQNLAHRTVPFQSVSADATGRVTQHDCLTASSGEAPKALHWELRQEPLYRALRLSRHRGAPHLAGALLEFSCNPKFLQADWAMLACQTLETLFTRQAKDEALKAYIHELIKAPPSVKEAQKDQEILQLAVAGFGQLMTVACHKEGVLETLMDKDILPCLIEGFGAKATKKRISGFIEHFDFLKIYARDPKTLESATNALFCVNQKAFDIRSEQLLEMYSAAGRKRATQKGERRVRTTFEAVGIARWLCEQGAFDSREHMLCEALAFLHRAKTTDVAFERLLFLHLSGWPVAKDHHLEPQLERFYVAWGIKARMSAVEGFKAYLRDGEASADSDYGRHLRILRSPRKVYAILWDVN